MRRDTLSRMLVRATLVDGVYGTERVPGRMAKRHDGAGMRFDQSFVVRTIRDFFISLLIIITLELGVRFAVVIWDYHTAEKTRTKAAAEGLAGDVRSIMINRGGPVAARTVYPILESNYEKRGLDIAIVPSKTTVKSIEERFGRSPKGVPETWSEGEHHEAKVEIAASEFCLQCHVEAEPGDTLGWVTVRNYRDTHIAQWLESVWMSGIFGMSNVVIHTVVLFALLRLRMEPLLGLRAVIARLARAGSDLSHRAPVRSGDEFGELANDVNLFLDRLNHILADVGKVLSDVDSVARRLHAVGGAVDTHAANLADIGDRLAALAEVRERHGAPGDAAVMASVLAALEAIAAHVDAPAATRDRLSGAHAQLRDLQGATESGSLTERMAEVNRESQAFTRSVSEMRQIEARMHALAAEGQRLLARLGHDGDDMDGDRDADGAADSDGAGRSGGSGGASG